MFKNRAGQKLTVYAFNRATGEPVVGDAANIRAYISQNDGDVVQLDDTSATEQDADKAAGLYLFDLLAVETNADKLTFSAESDTPNVIVLPVPQVVYTIQTTGSGVLNARVAYSSLSPELYLEIIQGEAKNLTFVIEADGRFDNPSAESLTITMADPSGHTITKDDVDIERIAEEWDVQVLRTSLTAPETDLLTGGLLRIEITLDSQKAVLTHAVKIVEKL